MKLGSDPASDLVLTPLERAVLGALGEQAGADPGALRSQAATVEVLSRSHSGVGFVTRLRVPAAQPAVAGAAGVREWVVHASHPGLAEKAEFRIQLKRGYLASIEAGCASGMWPEDETRFRIGH